MSDFKDPKDFVLPIICKASKPDPYAEERNVYEPGICMRQGCGEPRWQHPEKGELVVCEDHGEEILAGFARAPSLLPCRDHVTSYPRNVGLHEGPKKEGEDDE